MGKYQASRCGYLVSQCKANEGVGWYTMMLSGGQGRSAKLKGRFGISDGWELGPDGLKVRGGPTMVESSPGRKESMVV